MTTFNGSITANLRGASLVQVLAHAALELAELRHLFLLRGADAAHELEDRFGRIAAAANAGQRRHTRIVPAVDVLVVDELFELALARHGEHQIRARKLDLAGPARLPVPELVQEPVIERPVILELERANECVVPSIASDRVCA